MKGCKHRLDWVVLLLLVACNRPHNTPVEMQDAAPPPIVVSPKLLAIDSLMWTQPDSALALLCRDFACNVSTTEHDRHYANLLLAELRYKNDSAQANRAELRHAVAYFDSLAGKLPPFKGARGIHTTQPNPTDNLFFLSARAHYINGVGYYEHDSVVEACREYLTALETMENHFDEKDLVGKKAKFMALTYTHLTGLFSDLYLHEQAIYFGKQALGYYNKHDATPWHIAWILNEIGSHYEMMGVYDSATIYYQVGIKVLNDNKSLSYRDLKTRLMYCAYLMKKDYPSSLNQLRELLDQAEDKKELLSRSLTIAEVFYHETQYDSAWLYLRKVYEGTKSVDSKKQAAEWLVEICEIQGRTTEAMEYAYFLVPFANMNENKGFLKSQLSELCREYIQKKQEKVQQQQYRENLIKGRLVSLVVISLVLLGSFVYYIVNKKRHNLLRVQNERTKTQLETERYAHEIQQKALAGKLRKSNDSLRLQYEMVAKLQESMETKEPCIPRKTEYVALMNEDICISIVQRLKKAEAYSSFDVKDYASLALSDKEMEELIHAIDLHCPDFSKRMKRTYPGLGINDLQLCRLYLLDLSVLQVAILLGTDYSSIRKRTNRLKEKTGSEELCRNLKSTLFEE